MTALNGQAGFREVNAANPCPKCRKPDWCAVAEDGGACCCRRVNDGTGEERTDAAGATYYLYRLAPSRNGHTSPPPRFTLADGKGERADPDTLNKVYGALLDALPLDDLHIDRLRRRGLKGDLRAAGYRSHRQRGRAKVARVLIDAGLEGLLPRVPGFFLKEGDRGAYWTVGGAAGLLIPIRDVEGRVVALQVRADFAGKGPRYSFVSSKRRGGTGPGAPVHVPLFSGDKTTVRVTEGGLKANVATELSGVLTIGLPGLAWQKAAAVLRQLGAKTARVALDADARRKPEVGGALVRLVRDLRARGFAVELERWAEDGGKGIDDLLAAGKGPEMVTGDDALAAAEEIDRAARGSPDAQSVTSHQTPAVFRNYFFEESLTEDGKPKLVKVGLSAERVTRSCTASPAAGRSGPAKSSSWRGRIAFPSASTTRTTSSPG